MHHAQARARHRHQFDRLVPGRGRRPYRRHRRPHLFRWARPAVGHQPRGRSQRRAVGAAAARSLHRAALGVPGGAGSSRADARRRRRGAPARRARPWTNCAPARSANGSTRTRSAARSSTSTNQRRGFRSNRKAERRSKENEEGKIKQGEHALDRAMADAGADTLAHSSPAATRSACG
ncbi:hypothetical protein AB5I41_23395 [Sphingomonas sp. MMS24-JH45]